MAPIRNYSTWNKRPSDGEEQQEPYRKYFFICEGVNTEVWYLKYLINIKKQLRIHPLIDIILMERTGKDRSHSNPKNLFEYARAQKRVPDNRFDSKHDRMIIVFDADIYKDKNEDYMKIISKAGVNDIIGVTNPSFELFLLLHFERAYEEIIEPNKIKILENELVGKRRYIVSLFTEKSGMNPKENQQIGELATKIRIAIEQEKNLNQDPYLAIGNLTSNIGKIIEMIMNDSALLKP